MMRSTPPVPNTVMPRLVRLTQLRGEYESGLAWYSQTREWPRVIAFANRLAAIDAAIDNEVMEVLT